jgi:hypothetical protein
MSPVDFTVNILLTAIMRCGCCFVATFCTASRALACGSRQAVAEPAQGSRTGDAKCRARSRETRRVTATRTRASAGNGRRLSAPGASAVAVPSRGGGGLPARRADAGRLSPLPAAGGCSPSRGLPAPR